MRKDTAGQKWERTRQRNRPGLGTLTPYLGISEAPVNPIAGEHPVSKRGDDTGTENDCNESHPYREFL